MQACDGMHSKYPAALNLQARVMYHVGDADSAVALQLKALAYFEQLEGLDSSAVRLMYLLRGGWGWGEGFTLVPFFS